MASQRRKCINDVDQFCYICGSYTLPKQRRKITDFIKKLYFAYFKMKLGDQEKSWAPHIVCKTYITNLRSWSLGKRKGLAFGIPIIWREPQNHISDCYFCIAETKGPHAKNLFPSFKSAIRPVLHCPISLYLFLKTSRIFTW